MEAITVSDQDFVVGTVTLRDTYPLFMSPSGEVYLKKNKKITKLIKTNKL